MSENVITLRGFEPAKFAQDVLLVAGEAVSLTQRTDLGQAAANLLEVAALCFNQAAPAVAECPPEVSERLGKIGYTLENARNHLLTIVAGCRVADDPALDASVDAFLECWNAITGDDLAQTDSMAERYA